MHPHARPLGQPVAALGQGQVVRLRQQPQQRRLPLARDPRSRPAAHPPGGPSSLHAGLPRPAVGGRAPDRTPRRSRLGRRARLPRRQDPPAQVRRIRSSHRHLRPPYGHWCPDFLAVRSSFSADGPASGVPGMTPSPATFPTTATHWGTYRGEVRDGRLVALHPFEGDPDPSPIARNVPASLDHPARIRRPAVRRSFLEKGHAAGGEGRGAEPFVEVGWDEALDLVAAEVDRVRREHGNAAIFGASYGWASAGRFHHAQSQLHRFLNRVGGYTRSVNAYSYAAAQVIVPRVLGDSRGLLHGHTSWSSVAEHADLVLMLGGMPLKNAQVDPGGTGRHVVREQLLRARARGARFVLLSPLREDALA